MMSRFKCYGQARNGDVRFDAHHPPFGEHPFLGRRDLQKPHAAVAHVAADTLERGFERGGGSFQNLDEHIRCEKQGAGQAVSRIRLGRLRDDRSDLKPHPLGQSGQSRLAAV